MEYPLVSVVIATYNSSKALAKVLDSLKVQNYPKNKLEIFIIDGGSFDSTLSIAKNYKCKILKNPKVDQVYAKYMGYLNAKGDYLLLLDSDEVLENKNSIKLKVLSIINNKKVGAVISSGLVKPKSYSDINYYLNEFGDPFSFFMYRDSKDPRFFLNQLKSKYEIVNEDKDRIIFDFSKSQNPPFIELTAMSVMVNLKYIKANIPSIFKDIHIHTHLFYLLNSKKCLFAVMKHDRIIHYSVPTLNGYLRKIRSRIKSNIFQTEMGIAGFTGRENYYPSWYKLKKYLFIFYTLSIVLPFADSIYMFLTRRKFIYFIHLPLSFYTLILIVLYYVRSLLGLKTKLHGYGS